MLLFVLFDYNYFNVSDQLFNCNIFYFFNIMCKTKQTLVFENWGIFYIHLKKTTCVKGTRKLKLNPKLHANKSLTLN